MNGVQTNFKIINKIFLNMVILVKYGNFRQKNIFLKNFILKNRIRNKIRNGSNPYRI